MKKVIDLTNKIFNGVTVLKRDFIKETEIQLKNPKYKKICWECKCHCGNIFSVIGNSLKTGQTTSCGCNKKQAMSISGKKNSKQNHWIFKDNVAIGITFKNENFYIDIEDYEKVKYYCWRTDKLGYIVANTKDTSNHIVRLSRLIMEAKNNEFVDHKNWDKLNNCKYNLRKCTKAQNNINIKRKSNNTSGYTGVKLTKSGKWVSQISLNNNRIHLGTFNTFEEAVKARHEAEKIIHKDFNGEINRQNFISVKNTEINVDKQE